jgi:plastocyanin
LKAKIDVGLKISTVAVIVVGIAAGIAIVYQFGLTAPYQEIVYAQESNESSMSTPPVNVTLITPGQKEFYLFSVEIPEVNEETLRIAGDAYSVPTMVVNKGDNVTVHFYNVDPNTSERHTFTIGSPYNVDLDLAGGESDVVSFVAYQEGIFQYYCKYHLPVMTGQLVVEPS